MTGMTETFGTVWWSHVTVSVWACQMCADARLSWCPAYTIEVSMLALDVEVPCRPSMATAWSPGQVQLLASGTRQVSHSFPCSLHLARTIPESPLVSKGVASIVFRSYCVTPFSKVRRRS